MRHLESDFGDFYERIENTYNFIVFEVMRSQVNKYYLGDVGKAVHFLRIYELYPCNNFGNRHVDLLVTKVICIRSRYVLQ